MNTRLERGIEEIIDKKHLQERLEKGDKLRVKLGIDPTSPNIHIGRAVQLWKLKQFQDLGHQAIFIVGDATGRIGDTSDKDAERPMLTEDEIKINTKTYFDQAFKILDPKKTETHYNSEWLDKLGLMDLAKMANLFGLHEFASREVIAKRMEAGKRVSFHELLYPIFQGYDSVAVKADVELGGTDQRFNLLAGRTIQRFYSQEPQDIVMTSLLEGTDGRKMSSAWGNVINITEESNSMFGKVMSISDDLIIRYFNMATQVPANELAEIETNLKNGTNPRDIKLRLAGEIVKMYHGVGEAQKALEEWQRVFSKGELPEFMPEYKEGNIIDVIVDSGLVESKSEAKRLLSQNAVQINDQTIVDWGYKVKKGDVIRVGTRKFLRVV